MNADEMEREIAEDLATKRRAYNPMYIEEPRPQVQYIPVAPAPTTKKDTPFSQFGELMTAMVEMEKWKMTMLQNEMLKQQSMESRIRSQIEREFESRVTDDMDPTTKIALDFIVDLAKKSMLQSPITTTGQQKPDVAEHSQPKTADNVSQPQALETPASSFQEDKSMEFTQETADMYADKIYEKFPAECIAAQEGKITKEDAVAKIMQSGCTESQAAMIYQSIMDTDYSEPVSGDVQK